MAIVQTGATQTFTALGSGNTGTVSSTITVPSDAELIVVGWSAFAGTANFYSSGSMTFTKGGADTAMTSVAGGDATANEWMCGYFYLNLPDTGTNKTLKWDWLGTGTAGTVDNVCTVTFWKGNDTTSAARGTGAGHSGVSTPYTTGTITAANGDLIIAMVGAFSKGAGSVDTWSNLTSVTQTNAATAFGAVAIGSPSGNTTVAASTDTLLDDGSIVAASFKVPASGAPFVNPTGRSGPWDIPGTPTWQQAYNLGLYKNPIPFSQYDWAKPFRVPHAPYDLSVALNPNLFKNPIPNNQYHYPQSFRVPHAPYDLSVGLNPNLFKNPIPFLNLAPTSFPVAYLPVPPQPYNQSLYTVTVVVAPFVNLGPTSFPVSNFPIPSLNINLFTNPIPFVNIGPTSFAISNFPVTQQIYNPNLYQVVVSTLPFNQTFWPPASRVPNAPIDFYNLVLFEVSALPFSQTDQSVSVRFRSASSPDQPYNPNLYTVTVVSVPFNQTDWTPSPRIRLIEAPDQIFNPNLFTNPYPIQNLSLALVPTRSFPLLDAPYNQALYSTPATPLPFNTYDYPRTVRVQVAPYDLSFGLNTNLFTNPIPIFNYAYPTQHAQPPSLLDGSIGFQILNIPVVASTLIQRTLTGVGL